MRVFRAEARHLKALEKIFVDLENARRENLPSTT